MAMVLNTNNKNMKLKTFLQTAGCSWSFEATNYARRECVGTVGQVSTVTKRRRGGIHSNTGRTKFRQPQTWKSTQKKEKGDHGEEYTTKSGKNVPKKIHLLSANVDGNVEKMYLMKHETIHEHFRKIGDWNGQTQYIVQNVMVRLVKIHI